MGIQKDSQSGDSYMDKYFRAVGFSRLNSDKQFEKLLQSSFRSCETKYMQKQSSGAVILNCLKYFGKGIGLGLSGKIEKNEVLVLKKWFPYAESKCPIGALNVELEEVNNDRLALFYDKKNLNQFVVKLHQPVTAPADIKLLSITALSAKGKILLPVVKEQNNLKKQEAKMKRKLLFKSFTGDKSSFNELNKTSAKTSEDIKKRMMGEDFFSIVEKYFQPNDESDFTYDILADILNVETITNSMTDEKLYSMTLDVTGTNLQLYINHSDLIGTPYEGMRFWGVCALNGNVLEKTKRYLPTGDTL
jgi:hypothetical protein